MKHFVGKVNKLLLSSIKLIIKVKSIIFWRLLLTDLAFFHMLRLVKSLICALITIPVNFLWFFFLLLQFMLYVEL